MSDACFLGPFDHRVAAALPEGYVVGTCKGDCPVVHGSMILGVSRALGEQRWVDEHGHAVMVDVEDFDLDRIALRNWATGVE